jgi:hypothetical protein
MKQNLLVFIITISVLFYPRLVCLQTIPIGFVIDELFLYIVYFFFNRFRIVTWNVENKKPDCNTFEHLAFASSSNGFKADLIVFGYNHYQFSKKMIMKSFGVVFKKRMKNYSGQIHFMKH